MADNLCGPSTPTKGLVGHFDRNRSNQQDRLVNLSPASGSSVRSSRHFEFCEPTLTFFDSHSDLPRSAPLVAMLPLVLLPAARLSRT